jgi:hypothetical protein
MEVDNSNIVNIEQLQNIDNSSTIEKFPTEKGENHLSEIKTFSSSVGEGDIIRNSSNATPIYTSSNVTFLQSPVYSPQRLFSKTPIIINYPQNENNLNNSFSSNGLYSFPSISQRFSYDDPPNLVQSPIMVRSSPYLFTTIPSPNLTPINGINNVSNPSSFFAVPRTVISNRSLITSL